MESTDEGSESHEFAVERDWPSGLGEATWWPIVVVASVVGMYVGGAVYLVGKGGGGATPTIGLAIAAAGFVGFVVGAGGWLYQGFVSDYWEHRSPIQGRSLKFGMILFLATDVATFGALFVYYFVVRLGGVWPDVTIPPGLLSTILALNTAALFVSSFTFYWGERRLMRGDRRGFLIGVGVTVLLGAGFLVGQAIEYYGFITREGFTLTSGLFASAFFGLTGLHGMHVLLGVILLSTVFVRGYSGQYSDERHVSVSTVGWYWHFVDGVWLFLVTSVYVGSQLL